MVQSLKAWICAHGDCQIKNVDFFDTFAPVVCWTTIQLMLVMATKMNLVSHWVHYTAAFVHADIDNLPGHNEMTPEEQRNAGVCVQMPRGFLEPGCVLHLKKSLCGL